MSIAVMISSLILREPLGVEGVVVAEELEQVDAGQVAGGVVQVEVLRAGVAGGDAARLRVGVPVVDRVVVLDAGVGAVPGGLGDLAEQLPSRRPARSTSPVRRASRSNSLPSSTACMNSSQTRTELLAFWYWTLTMSWPPRSMSNPASRRARIFSSSRALVSMNSSTSGWSTSRTTILAARRVAPPDLIVPAEASAPRMKQTGPLAVPPEDSSSLLERIRDRLTPAPEPPLKIRPSSLYQSRIDVHRVVDGQDEARARPAGATRCRR